MRKLLFLAVLLFNVPSLNAQAVRVAHGCWVLGPSGGTTPAIDTTGANFIFVSVSYFSNVALNLTDSKGNTYTNLTQYGSGTAPKLRAAYSTPGSVGTSHTFSTTADYSSICVEAWSGMAVTSVFDTGTDAGATLSGSTISPGSITPSSGLKLILSAVGNAGIAATFTVSPYTLGDQVAFATNNFGLGLAYSAQAGGTPTNPTWTLSASEPASSLTAAFLVAGAGLTANNISRLSHTTTSVSLIAGEAAGGTSPYTHQWYRSTTSGFTPGGGNILTGKTALTLTDTGLTPLTTYYYVLRYTDSASATADAAQFIEVLPTVTPVVVCFIGDSITQGTGAIAQLPAALQMVGFLNKTGSVSTTYSGVNRGISGTTTADWVPTGTDFLAAVSAMQAASCSVVSIMLGTNDAKVGGASQAVYSSNMQGIITALKAAGFGTLVVHQPLYINSTSPWDVTSSNVAVLQYGTALQALAAADPSHVFMGDTLGYAWFQGNQSQSSDGVHPNDNGHVSLGYLWAQAYRRLFLRDAASLVIVQ